MKKNKKGSVGVGDVLVLTVGLIVGVILLVSVLIPVTTSVVTTAGNTSAYLGNAYNTTTYYQTSFSGISKVLTDNFTTFILLGTLVLIAGLVLFGMSRR